MRSLGKDCYANVKSAVRQIKMEYSKSQIEQIIFKKFSASFMSDSKWEKMIDKLTDALDREVFITFKLVHDSKSYCYSFCHSDFKPFFAEPTVYKEVEWIEFPDKYEYYVSRDNRKAGTKIYDQNLEEISRALENIGKYELEYLDNSIKLYAYQ
ncbi:hypothetical protein MNBD_GAMMA12-84 [hydrothermal vent metagenome]|uniref:Uncharacterized protein n=1 Tax=hydrothermal vent metagenome TaxID=652676 RepID=A0A3B0Y7V1_9ZZZZ